LRSDRETANDRMMVQKLANALDVPVHHHSLPKGLIESRARDHGESVEQAARQLRYEALVMIAGRIASEDLPVKPAPAPAPAPVSPPIYLITAHHRDDQTETVLSRIADGHPATVPVSIPRHRVLTQEPVPVVLVRPALGVAGGRIRDWGAQRGFTWAEDSTNRDVRFRRNALRHRVMPHIADVLPESPRMIARYGTSHDRLLQSLSALIPADARGRFENNSTWVVSRAAFEGLPEAAREVVLRDAAYELSSSSRVDGGFIREILRRLATPSGAASRTRVSGNDLLCVVSDYEISLDRDIVPVSQRGYLWPVSPGRTITLLSDRFGVVPSREFDAPTGEGTCVACTSITFPAILREYRPGDAILRQGRTRSLGEVARREAVPRNCRDGAAIVESEAGIEAAFWRGSRFVVRDGGAWSTRCGDNEPSAVIFRMRG
jgi:tRNA(Ile)-lysidine synthase TilS/MesJ